MADNIHFPSVNFDWLGELPAIAESASQLRARKATLAGLTSGSAADLEKAGSRLLASGDFEGGLKLLTESRNRRAVDQRSFDTEAYNKFLQTALAGRQGTAAEPTPIADFTSPQEAPPAAVPVAPAPNFGPNPLATPGPGAGLTLNSPSDAIIAAAQGQTPPQGAGPQLAGPPPAPQGLPPPAVPSIDVAGPQGANPVRTQPLGGETPQAPVAPRAIAPALPAGAESEVRSAASKLLFLGAMGNRAPRAAVDVLMSQFRDALDKTKLDKEQKNWQIENMQRRMDGARAVAEGRQPTAEERPISQSEFEENKKLTGPLFTDYEKVNTQYRDLGDKARGVKNIVQTMSAVANNPKFVTGMGAKEYGEYGNRISTITDAARAIGLPVPSKETIDSWTGDITKMTQLQELQRSLSAQLTKASLGSYGTGISNADRESIESAYPQLTTSKEGTKLLLEFQRAQADHNIRLGNIARTYAAEKQPSRLRGHELQTRIDQERDNSNILVNGKTGEKTDLGKRIEAVSNSAPAPTAAPTAPRSSYEGRDVLGPDGKVTGKIVNGVYVPTGSQGL